MKIKLLAISVAFFMNEQNKLLINKNVYTHPINDLILWSNEKHLHWDLFKSKKPPEQHQNMSAVTSVVLIIENEVYSKDLVTLSICNYFVSSKSWKSQNTTPDLLNHEQRHFDLHEIYARRLRKAVSNLTIPENPSEIRWSLDKQRLNLRNDFINLSAKYDKETEHGLIKHQQDIWDNYIDSLLLDLIEFENVGISIKKNINREH